MNKKIVDLLIVDLLTDLSLSGAIHISEIDDDDLHDIDWRVIKNTVKIVDGWLLWR